MTSIQKASNAVKQPSDPMATGWAIPIRFLVGVGSGLLGYLLVVEFQRIFGLLDGLGGIAFFEFDVSQSFIWAVPIGLVLCCYRLRASNLAKGGLHLLALILIASYLVAGIRLNQGAPVPYATELTTLVIAPVTVVLYFLFLVKLNQRFEAEQ